MWLMLQIEQADDFVIATGQTNSLQDFVAQVFACFGLDWTQHVLHDDQLMRPNEIAWSQGNPQRAKQLLGWQATKNMNDVIKILCAHTPKAAK